MHNFRCFWLLDWEYFQIQSGCPWLGSSAPLTPRKMMSSACRCRFELQGGSAKSYYRQAFCSNSLQFVSLLSSVTCREGDLVVSTFAYLHFLSINDLVVSTFAYLHFLSINDLVVSTFAYLHFLSINDLVVSTFAYLHFLSTNDLVVSTFAYLHFLSINDLVVSTFAYPHFLSINDLVVSTFAYLHFLKLWPFTTKWVVMCQVAIFIFMYFLKVNSMLFTKVKTIFKSED